MDGSATSDAEGIFGMCTACGSIETRLLEPTGTRDLSRIGASAVYPTGYGCELCSCPHGPALVKDADR